MSLLDQKPEFYVVGGTLHHDAPSYVHRAADRALYESLLRGEFCYVLTPRQMGKSSLMIRTAVRLLDDENGVVLLDLTSAGQNLTVEQWFGGLLVQLGQQLEMEDELLAFWGQRTLLSPLQRWMAALREEVLPRAPRRLFIFIDEIDAVRSLPFSTDEFFAGIREFYNRRTQDRELERLTFCLLGVATPSDLIRNPNTTPFNIGTRIELTDFTASEAQALAQGLGCDATENAQLLERIYDWTHGHPYLTQQLCRSVAHTPGIRRPNDVDALCEELFFSAQARERDDNLLFVRDRMLRGEQDLVALLGLYARILRKGSIRLLRQNAATNPLLNTLQLSGITRVRDGEIVVRNRIYARVFDAAWVRASLPEDEAIRQRMAVRRAVFRTVMSVLFGLLLFGTPILYAYRQHGIAAEEEIARKQLSYASNMNQAGPAWETANINQLRDLVEARLPRLRDRDLRNFEWYYYWRQLHRDRRTLPHDGAIQAVCFSPDDRTVATAGTDGKIRLWNAETGELRETLAGHPQSTLALAYSPSGATLASAGADRTIRLWEPASGQERAVLAGHANYVGSLAFSPDEKTLASASWDHQIKLWDLETRRERLTLAGHEGWVWAVEFSPDGRRLASASEDRSVRIWDARTGASLRSIRGFERSVYGIAFSPDGSRLASCSEDGAVRMLDPVSGELLATINPRSFAVVSVAFSPDSRWLAAAGMDRIVRVWNAATLQNVAELRGHAEAIRSLRFSSNGRTIATASDDHTAKLWDVEEITSPETLAQDVPGAYGLQLAPDHRTVFSAWKNFVYQWDLASGKLLRQRETLGEIRALALSPDGRTLALGHDGNAITYWDAGSLRQIGALNEMEHLLFSLCFSPDSRLLAMGNRGHQVKIWERRSGKELATLEGHSRGVRSVAFSSDGALLASGSDDGTVKIWDAKSWGLLQTLTGPTSEVWIVAFSPDGKQLAAAGNDRVVRLFDTSTWQVTQILMGHAAGIRTLAFSDDGSRLASGADDQTIRLWDPKTGHQLMMFPGHAGRITATIFSPEHQMFLTASRESPIRLWRAARPEDVAARPPSP